VKRSIVLPKQVPAKQQRGAAFLVLVLMIGIVGTALIVSAGTSSNDKLGAAENTAKALATARDALIAFAVSVPDSARPGDLPCPATDYTTGIAAASCNTSASRQGYLPWNTLGLPKLSDGSGAPLLYAVSNIYKNSPRVTATLLNALNSDQSGEFSVNGENAIAVIFAPGSPFSAQNRNAGIFSLSNFLESSNADGDTSFQNSAESNTYNDRLIWITPRAFFPPIEMRALRVAQAQLQNYFSVTGRYPMSNRYQDDYSCWTFGGRLPYAVSGNPCLPGGNGATAGQWTSAWPAWFYSNYWDYVFHYAVAERCTTNPGTICGGSGN